MGNDNLDDLVAATSAALQKGLSDYANERERKAAGKVASAELAASLRRVKNAYASSRERSLQTAKNAIGSYCSRVRKSSLEAVEHDPRMPRLINYKERYNALLGMKNRTDVLRRIEQTIDLADTILAQRDQVDPDSVLKEVAQDYVGRVLALNGIKVTAAEKQAEDETNTVAKKQSTESLNSFEKSIEEAFLSSFRGLNDEENELISQMGETLDHVANIAEQLPRAINIANKAIDEEKEEEADAVAGKVFAIAEPEPFGKQIVLESDGDAKQLELLASLVRASFKVFAQVVRDNGLFSAFSHEPSYGACAGWRDGFWLDDFVYGISAYEGDIPGRGRVADIPDTIEEDEGGDTLERTIERMEKFNKRRYFGLLDDDFDEHVDAFWYGFKKLMIGVNGLFRMNPSEFNTYCNDVAESAKQAVAELGAASMDQHQLEAFCEEVEKRGREGESE